MEHLQMNKGDLALEIARTLNDEKSLRVYRKFTEMYNVEYLRRILMLVMEVPDEEIKKSRAAYFTYLVQQFNGYFGS